MKTARQLSQPLRNAEGGALSGLWSEVWDILFDGGLPQGHGVEWLFEHLDRAEGKRA